jgi:uncharacterized membrane protein YeaQ/YmgE (transglycosylase-associated protein family)
MRKFVATISVVFYVLIGLGLSFLQVPAMDLTRRLAYDVYHPGIDMGGATFYPPAYPLGLGFDWVAYLPLTATLLTGLVCLVIVSACQDEDRLESFGMGLFLALIIGVVGWFVLLWIAATVGMDYLDTGLWAFAWLIAMGIAVVSGIFALDIQEVKAGAKASRGDEFVTRRQVEKIVDRRLDKKKRR